MAKNVMKVLKPSPNLGRNAFDLSHRNIFTANFGELLPCCCLETVPSNDYVEIKPANLLRAMPLATSPFLRAKQHIDFWFVPYSSLWSRFNEFMSDKNEPSSSSLKSRDYLPYTGLDDLYVEAATDNKYDVVGQDYSRGARKLLNLLGYSAHAGWVSEEGQYKVNLFRLAAYNFIWYKEYRQKYYDDGTYLMNPGVTPSYLWNLDDVLCNSVSNADVFLQRSHNTNQAMLQMRYRCFKKDLFTGLMPSTQFGSVSVVNSSSLHSRLSFVDSSGNSKNYVALSTTNNGDLVGSTTLQNGSAPSTWANTPVYMRSGQDISSLNILDLRKAEAVQRWRENALRAGNQIEDNFEAHYGAKPHSHMITHPIFIGSYSAPLNIGDVVSTAHTGDGVNSQLGDIAGKGISSLDGQTIKFKTTDFGVIMGLFSLLPEAEYNALGVDRMNQLLEREDFFIPEYENLGLEPVPLATFFGGYINTENVSPVVGFAPRYWGYKQKFDQCFGEMMHNYFNTGMFAHWCSPKADVVPTLLNNDGTVPLSCLYVNPAIYDVNFNTGVADNDQFLVDQYNEVTAIRGMSVSGMPNY